MTHRRDWPFGSESFAEVGSAGASAKPGEDIFIDIGPVYGLGLLVPTFATR